MGFGFQFLGFTIAFVGFGTQGYKKFLKKTSLTL